MRKLILTLLALSFHTLCLGQTDIRDSIFVRLDTLRPNKLSYDVRGGKLVYVGVFIKNKYESVTSFLAIKNNSDLALIKVKDVNPSRVVSYSTFNGMLEEDFLNILFYTKVYLVVSKSKEDFLVLFNQSCQTHSITLESRLFGKLHMVARAVR